MPVIKVKRIYEAADPKDGVRILVDRVWPRGMTKEAARIDVWLRDVAPSTPLRKWFGHDPALWNEFRKRYFAELDQNIGLVEEILGNAEKSVTLLFGAKEQEHNNAVALKEYLLTRAPNAGDGPAPGS